MARPLRTRIGRGRRRVRPAEQRTAALLVQRPAGSYPAHQSLLDVVGKADVRSGTPNGPSGNSGAPTGRVPAQLRFEERLSGRNGRTDHFADERVVSRPEVHEAVGASKKSQIPNPKSQLPITPPKSQLPITPLVRARVFHRYP